MSESPARDTEPQQSAGAMLRAARQAQGLHLVSLAAQLKIAPRKLEALEADRLDELQGSTYVRALAQAACRVLKIDPAPVLARLPRTESSTLEQVSGGLNAPFKERSGQVPLLHWVHDNRWTLVVGGLLLASASVLWLAPPGFWMDRLPNWTERTASVQRPSSAVMEPSLPKAALLVASAASSAALVAPPDSAASGSSGLSTYQPAGPASAPLPAPAAASGPGSAAAFSPVASSPNLAGVTGSSVTVQLSAREPSWVEVVDARGKPVFSKLLAAGESAGFEGVFPMRVKIGNAAGTDLVVRGQPIDLLAVTRDNVARLELK